MTTPDAYQTLTTISAELTKDWHQALRKRCSEDQVQSLLGRSGMIDGSGGLVSRVSHAQFVALYQRAALETGDEMMGLWERPIRARALQHLLTAMRDAETAPSALYRFTTFWNLLLDNWQLSLTQTETMMTVSLEPVQLATVQRFGHMLMLKLAHGLMSWIVGQEVPLKAVGFAFDRPDFAQDYASLFPAPVQFSQKRSSISFDASGLARRQLRTKSDMGHFLKRAPEDWIFTRSLHHSFALRLRAQLMAADWEDATLQKAAAEFGMTPRTLMRRLSAERCTFQSIKDDLRRDLALQALRGSDKTIEEIAFELGFSSAANFHRSFKRWTGGTPAHVRRSSR